MTTTSPGLRDRCRAFIIERESGPVGETLEERWERETEELAEFVRQAQAEAIEAAAKVAETDLFREQVTPAHDVTDDWGDVIYHQPQRTMRMRVLKTGKAIAAAIRSLGRGEERHG